MGKLLFWVLIVLCALVAMRLAVRSQQPPSTNPRKPAKGRARSAKAAEPMVACAHCGVYLPRSDALQGYGQTWCCREHADQHPHDKVCVCASNRPSGSG